VDPATAGSGAGGERVGVHLYVLPIVFVLAGLVLYVVLAGADFGAGFWQLTAGGGEEGEEVRGHAHRSMAPVWEANHVWLIFVLTVMWTAYPAAFASIASTLSVALFVAGVGIVFRGAAYALRSGTEGGREQRRVDTLFAVSSILTPFALGAAVGGIASFRVPVGNAGGNLFSSWLNPTSVAIGVLAVATGAYLAAVFLSADARRLGEPELERRFRARALGAGVVTGGLALASLVVLHSDDHRLYAELVEGDGLAALIASGLAGVATLGLVYARRFELARYCAAGAVAAIVAGWGLAQYPVLLPGLTVEQAAASHDVLVAVVIAVLAGAALLFPSLGTLFRLVLRGRLDLARPEEEPPRPAGPEPAGGGLYARVAAALLVAGVGFLNVAEPAWAHAIGATCLLAFVAVGFRAALPLGGDVAGGADGR
jgi:cytochrome bd ubiquinol oxidase subunit II